MRSGVAGCLALVLILLGISIGGWPGGIVAIVCVGLFMHWYEKSEPERQRLARIEIETSARYKESMREIKAQWQAVLAVIESHAGTLAADRRRLVTTDKWGRLTGVTAWAEERRAFSADVLPTLIDCSGIGDELSALIPEVVDELASARSEMSASSPTDALSGEEFEHHCASILQSSGWTIRHTPRSGDQGVDLVATKRRWSVAIQCKRYEKPVGNSAVQEARAGLDFYGCDAAAVVATSGFTKSAQVLARSTRVRLFSPEQLCDLEPW